MQTPPTAPTFGNITRARLRALIAARGYSLTGLARKMKRSHTWILRKLSPDTKEPRPLDMGDVDAILAFLGEPATVLQDAVYRPGDRELLGLLKDGPVTMGQAEATIRGAAEIAARLEDQALVRVEAETITLA